MRLPLLIFHNYACRWAISLQTVFLAILLNGSILYATEMTISWQSNTESDLAGYHVYQRTLPSIDFGAPIFSGLPPTPSSPSTNMSNLQLGTTYGFVVTAYDTSGNESQPSEEKQITISATPDLTQTTSSFSFPPPLLAPAPGISLTTSTVTFTGAHTTQDYQHWIAVGPSPGSSQFGAGTLDANHQFTVTDLPSTGTLYVRYYTRVSATASWETQTYAYPMKVDSGSSTSQNNASTLPSTSSTVPATTTSAMSSSFPPPLLAPAPGISLTTSTVTFTGAHTTQDYQHWIAVGPSPGSSQFGAGTLDANHQFTVTDLPSTGTLYVRYYTRVSATASWESKTYTYQMNVKS